MIHMGMGAALQVGTNGTPVARPSIAVTIPAQSLRAVRRSGKLKVRVRALTRSDNTSVLATKSGIGLGRKSNIDLGAPNPGAGKARILKQACDESPPDLAGCASRQDQHAFLPKEG